MTNAALNAGNLADQAKAKQTGFRRKRLLGSGSALAAAIAMTAALADPVSAQSAQSQSAMPMHSQMRMDQNIHPAMRDMARIEQSVRAPQTSQPPVQTQNQTRNLPTPIAAERMMINRGVTLEVPEVPQTPQAPQVPSAPSVDTIQPLDNPISTGSVTTASSTPATTPGDTDTAGINVLATANYFSSDVDFRPGVAEDIVELFANQAIINWTTFDAGSAGATVDFLPSGANLRFTSAQSDYTVLNRVFTPGIDSAIRIDGSVTSDILSGGITGGNVWFYSPGGIVVGPTGSFDVGNLVLSSSEISAITSTGINFGGVAEPNTSVIIESGAAINATGNVAVVAPRIEQGGTVRAGGSIAYVGAEQAEITFIGSLFGISVLVGTDDANGIVHTGTTGGATPTLNPNRVISMDVQGRTGAVEMLLGGNIGYDDAAVASASNGSIFLTARDGAQANSGNITFGAGNINSSVFAQATGTIDLTVDGQTSELNFGSLTQNTPVSLIAEQAINISATSGANIVVEGDLTARASDGENGGAINVTIDDAGRDDAITTSGLTLLGDSTFDVSARGFSDGGSTGIGGDAVGGTINIDVSQGGDIVALGNISLVADAQGGFGGSRAGAATAGSVDVTITGANTRISADGNLSVTTQGMEATDPQAPPGFDSAPEFGSSSSGGAVNIDLVDGTLAVTSLVVDSGATATAGFAVDGTNTQDAVAGDVTINNSGNLDIFQLTVQANADGGGGGAGGFFENGAAGGSGTGGDITINSTADLANLSNLSLAARGNGGNGGDGGFSAAGGAGGAGQGGNVSMSVQGTGALLGNLSSLFIDTTGQGGNGAAGGTEASLTDSGDGGAGGAGIGGTSAFTIGGTGATFSFDSDLYQLQANGTGGQGGAGAFNFSGLNAGNGGDGGDGTGGTVSLEALSGSTLSLISGSVGFNLSSSGQGGVGGNGGSIDMVGGGFAGNGGNGGSGTGGAPTLIARGGTITGGNVEMFAFGFGAAGGTGGDDGLLQLGADGNGGDGSGGTPTIQTFDGSPGIIAFGNTIINASGFSGTGAANGVAAGGQISIVDGSPDPAGLISFDALNISVAGDANNTAGRLTFQSGSGAITVNGNLSADVAGDIVFDMDANGQVAVNGLTNLTATQNITGTHSNNASGLLTLDASSSVTASAGGDLSFGADSTIDAAGAVNITAANIAYDDITSTGQVNLTSTTGSITGTSTGTITASNVVDAINLLSAQDITFGNLVSLAGNIDIDAAGDITGVNANAAQFVNVDANGPAFGAIDIDTVTSGSLVTINGGSINIGTLNAGFIANLLTVTGDLSITTLNSASTVDLDSAGAIVVGNGLSGTFVSNSVADTTIGSLTTTGAVADVTITAGGTATYTNIDVDRQIRIDADAIVGGDLTVDANVILQANTVNIGAVTVEELGNIDIDAFTGELTTGALTGNTVNANGFGNLTIGAVNAVTNTDISAGGNATIGDVDTAGLTLNVTGNLDAANLNGTSTVATSSVIVGGDADIESMTVNNLLNINVTGALTGGALNNVGPIALVTINAGSIDVDAITSSTQTINVVAATGDAIIGSVSSGSASNITATNGNVQLGTVNSGAGTALTGENVILDSGTVGGTLRLNATAGDVSGTGTVAVTGAIDLDATGNIAFGTLNAGTTFAANAVRDITFDEASAASTLTFVAGGDIDFTTLGGGNTVTVTATGAINGGDVTTDQASADATFTAGTSVTLGDVTTRIFTVNATGDITLGAIDALGRDIRGIAIDLATAGNISFTSLTSGRGIDLGSATITGGDIISDNGINIAAETLILGNVAVTELGGVTIETTNGALTVGDVDSNTFGISLTSVAGLTAGDLTVTGTSNSSDIDVIANGDTVIGDATSGNQLDIDVTGNLTTGNLVSNVVSPGSTVNVTGDANIGGYNAQQGTALFTIGGALTGGTLAAEAGITINAASIDIGGAISRTSSITATAATGDAAIGNAQAAVDLTVTANNGTPTVGAFDVGDNITLTGLSVTLGAGDIVGDLSLNSVTGDVTLALDGNETINVGGATFIDASGDFVVTHINNGGGAASLNSTGIIDANVQGSIDAQAGSRLVSADTVFLRAEGNANVNEVAGVGSVTISAAGNVVVNNADVTGTPEVIPLGAGSLVAGPVLLIDAGVDSPFSGVYDTIRTATVTGQLTSTGTIEINAGGNAVFASGSNTVSDNGLIVQTGDDIIIADGASLVSGANPATTPSNANPFNDFNNLVLNAGGLGPLFSTPITPVASIVSNGTINANDFAVVMTAGAIDALGGTVIGSSIAADIVNAPPALIAPSDDNGLLSANCLQGTICFGNIEADNQLLIGQASNNDTIALIIEQGTVNANDILITTRNDIVMGTNGIATTLNATGSFTATSLTGDINLLDAVITSDQILINAAGSLLGSASLSSASDIGISVGQDLNAAAIVTGGQLIEAIPSNNPPGSGYIVPGSASIDLLSVGVGNINIQAGNSIQIGTAIVPGTDIFLSGGQLAQLDFTNSAVNVVLDGGSAVFGDITASGNVSADIGGTIDLTAIDAAGNIDLIAGTAITGGDLTAGGTATVDAQSISLGTVDATNILLNSASDIFFNSLISPNAITLTATGGTIGINTGPGDIDSGGNVALTAQVITVGNIDAAGGVDASASAGAVTVGDVTSNGLGAGISLTSAGAAGDINAGTLTTNSGDILLSAQRNIALAGAANSAATPTAGSIGLLAGGDITVTATLSAGEDLAVRSGGSTALAAVSAGDDITIEADGAITLDSATSTGTGIDLFALVLDTANAGQTGSIAFGAETSAGSNINLTGGTDVTVTGTLNSVGNVAVTAVGTPSIGNTVSGGDTSVTGASVTFDNGAIGGDLALTATAGDIDGNGTISVAGGIALAATGSIGFGTLVAQNGDFVVAANNDIVFTAIDSAGLVDLSAGGLIQGDRIDAVTDITLAADGSITIIHAETATDFTATAGGNFTTGLNSIITGGDIVVAGDIVDLGNSTAGGLINVTGTQIDFVNVIAGSTVTMVTDINTPLSVTGTGNLNITGTNITAGIGASNLNSQGSIDISGLTDVRGSLTMDALDNITFGDAIVQGGSFIATAGGTIDLNTAEASDEIDFLAGLDLTATGTITGSNSVFLESADGSVSGVDVTSGNDIDIRAASTVDFNDISVDLSQVNITAGSDVTINDVIAAADIGIISGGAIAFNSLEAAFTVDLTSQGATTGADIDVGNSVTASAGTDGFTVGNIVAGNDVIISSDGAVDVTTLTGAQSGTGDILVAGAAGITIDTLTGITASLQAANGAVAVAGNAAVSDLLFAEGESVLLRAADNLLVSANATNGDVDIVVGGDLTTVGISAAGNVLLESGGSVAVNAQANASNPLNTLPPGTQGLQQVTTTNGGNITITAATDILINSAVNAAADLTMTAGDLIDLQATASGATVNTLSGDINIGTGGALGRSDLTSEVSIATEGDIQLGGVAGASTGFELDNDEFSRVHSGGDLRITAIGLTTGEGNINVSDLDVAAGQGTGTPTDGNIANFGGLFLEADNDVNITGGLIIGGASPDNLLAIDAFNLITIDAETATVRLEDANGAVSGLIGMTADAIVAANAADLADVLGLSVADADTLLGTAPVTARPDGYIAASDIEFNVSTGVFIANSGAGTDFDDRRGVVANNVTVSSANPDVGIVINGVVDTLTGVDALGLVGVPAGFDAASTINGCVINNPAICTATTTPPTSGNPGPIDGPIRDLIDDQVEEESPVVDTISTILVELRQDPEQQEDPLLDEPVTGAGNEDFWFDEEDDEEEEEELEPAE
uniref:beta strand repeat-containing protein n=1 Tax=uncultured Erythrobacter sp. TaxID=263913 RepID=UPI0026067156|nr:hypothetical protein [uncultured Erythrobacter sp.]